MSKLYWFTDEDGNNIMIDHHGYLKGAIKKAAKYSNEYKIDVYINEGEDIVDVIFPDNAIDK